MDVYCKLCRGVIEGRGIIYCSEECRQLDYRHNPKPPKVSLKPSTKSKSSSIRKTSPMFVGVDGEGVTRCRTCLRLHDPATITPRCPGCGEGGDWLTHEYVLLSVGAESLTNKGLQLNWWDIFEFIWDYDRRHKGSVYIGFFLGYDWAHWLKGMPERAARKLFTEEGIQSRVSKLPNIKGRKLLPVDVRDPTGTRWELDALPNRRLRVKKATTPGWINICDVGPFWQQSFLGAIDPAKWDKPICTTEEYDIIVEGKSSRSIAGLDENMIRYNITENRVLAKLMTALDQGFLTVGIQLDKHQWFGPGQAAQAWLGTVKFPTHEAHSKAVKKEWPKAACWTQYGGMFSTSMHGTIGRLWNNDINSAYPYAMSKLPCLLHGTYESEQWEGGIESHKVCPAEGLEVWECEFVSTDTRIGGGLLVRRKDGSIHTPQTGYGWWWRDEIESAQRATGSSVRVYKRWVYTPCDCPPPLREIANLYQKRLEVGKNSTEGYAIKHPLNSVYGKLAQRVGTPIYMNIPMASLVTSSCRRQVLDAIATHPMGSQAVAMIATDGIFWTSPHPGLDLTEKKLGAWDEEVKFNTTIFKPGVYWDDKAREALKSGNLAAVKMKSRGVPARVFAPHINRIDDAFTNLMSQGWPTLEVPIPFSMVTPKLALARGKWDTCGKVSFGDVRLESSDPIIKRDNRPYRDGGVYRTDVYGLGDITHPHPVPMDTEEVVEPEGAVGGWFGEWMKESQGGA